MRALNAEVRDPFPVPDRGLLRTNLRVLAAVLGRALGAGAA